MAKVSLVKKSASAGKKVMKASPGVKLGEFQIQDNQDSTCTVFGVDAAGAQLDISAVATLTPAPSSSDPATVTVDPPTGMTFVMHAVGPLTTPGTPVLITAVATWNDGSIGPFTFDLPVEVQKSPSAIGGIVIVPGTPTIR